MKKISYFLILLAFVSGIILSCKKDDNGGDGPVKPEGEIADLVLEYPVEITISETSYDGANVEIDLDAIAELFEITKEELLAAIADSAGSPDITLYGIAASELEVSIAQNTDSDWGHWWDANGEAAEWANAEVNLAVVFARFVAGVGYFELGQYPNRLTDGQVITFYEGIKYNGKKAVCKFILTGKAPAVIEATVVNTQKLSMQVTERNTYDIDSVAFDLAKAIADLGITSIDEATLVAVKADGTYAQEKSADNGFWIDRSGYASGWGAGGVVFTDYNVAKAGTYVGIGQFPDSLKANDVLTAKFGFLANDKIEMIEVAITVVGFIDPEVTPAGDPITVDTTIAISHKLSADWVFTQAEIRGTLRNAFKMTTYQINKAINEKQLVFSGLNADGTAYVDTAGNIASSANYPGHWYDASGNVTTYGDETNVPIFFSEITHTNEVLQLNIGNHPDNATAGTVINYKQIAELNGGKVTFNIALSIVE